MFLNLVFYDPRRFNSVHFTHPHITPEEVVEHVIQLQLKFEVLRFCRSELLTQTVRGSSQTMQLISCADAMVGTRSVMIE